VPLSIVQKLAAILEHWMRAADLAPEKDNQGYREGVKDTGEHQGEATDIVHHLLCHEYERADI
jgi:hypothetical protein